MIGTGKIPGGDFSGAVEQKAKSKKLLQRLIEAIS
jgi:hypothetical protein